VAGKLARSDASTGELRDDARSRPRWPGSQPCLRTDWAAFAYPSASPNTFCAYSVELL
jgi:hypothetical protein